MADIRQTPELDDLLRADETPLSDGGKWDKAMSTSSGLLLNNNTIKPWGPGDATYFYDDGPYNGNCEVWGETWDAADETEAWRIGLMTEPDPAGTTVDGYLVLWIVGIGGAGPILRKYTNNSFTEVATGTSTGANGGLFLTRILGDDIQLWQSLDGGANWTMNLSYTDTTYRTALYPCLGISSDDGTGPGWISFGGGQLGGGWMPQYTRRSTWGPFLS